LPATNKNLEEEIDKQHFREDLFIASTSCRFTCRRCAIGATTFPALVRHFADLFARENNFHRRTFTAAAMEKLKQQHWRGNIRELRNFVERLMIMTSGESVDATGRPGGAASSSRRAAGRPPLRRDQRERGGAVVDAAATLQEFKSGSERAYLVAKLRENSWNISKTAR
jgi:two-component system nitrogen regulation response regulator NtrX